MIQRRIVVLLLSILLAIPTVFGGAQTPNPESQMSEESPGIQAGVRRTYGHPDAEIGRAMTVEDMATLTLRTIDITVTSFDSVDNAERYFESLSDIPLDLGTTSEAFDGELASDLGTQNFFRQRVADNQMDTTVMELLTVQQEEIVFTINLSFRASYRDGMEAPAEVTVPDVIAPLGSRIANVVSTDRGDVAMDDGNAADALWNLLPSAGDPLLLGLIPWIDLQTFPPVVPDDATPEVMPGEMTTPLDPMELDGLEAAGERLYYPADVQVGVAGVPMATPEAAQDPATRRELALSITVYQFATADDAAAAYDVLGDDSGMDTRGSLVTGTAESDRTELADLGDGAINSRMVISSSGHDWVRQLSLEQLTVLHSDVVIVIESVGNRGPAPTLDEAGDMMSPAIDVAAEMITAGSPSSTDTDFAADGTSTGGIWDLMPAAGDPVLGTLAPKIDIPILPPADE